MFPVVVFADHSAAEDIDCHSAAGMMDAAGTDCAEGTDHDSTDFVVRLLKNRIQPNCSRFHSA